MLLSTTTYPTTGSAGDTFWLYLNNVLLLHEANTQYIQNELEGTVRAIFGDGIIKGSYTPPLLSIGTGLNVNIAPHTTLNGFANKLANTYAQPIPPSVVKYLWELQNNTDLTPSYVLTDTIPVYPLPGTVDNLPTLLGQITTSGSAVTVVTELYRIIGPVGTGIWKEENFSLAWDSTDRTGGTIFAVTTSVPIDPNQRYEVFRSGVRMIEGATYDYQRSGSTFTFNDGYRPILDEIVTVDFHTL